MRTFSKSLFTFVFLAVLTSVPSTYADSYAESANEDLANGNLIAEPALTDYVAAYRMPGFSPISDISEE